MADQEQQKGSMKARVTRITWMTPSGWEVSEDWDEEVILTRLEPILDARAEYEGKRLRFGWNPAAYRELRRKCESARDELPEEVIEGFERLRKARKIQVWARPLPDGGIYIELCTRREDNVRQEVVEDLGRLLELQMFLQPGMLYAPDALARRDDLLRQRIPAPPKLKPAVKHVELVEAMWRVLLQPAAWDEHLIPEQRAPYLNAAVRNALIALRQEREQHENEPAEALPRDLPDSAESPIEKIIRREQEAKHGEERSLQQLRSRAGLSDRESQLIALIQSGLRPADALRELGLSKSVYINAYQKLKRAAGR